MSSPLHFYLTFNPFLNHEYEHDYTQAHEFYDFLKALIKKDKNSSAYWGKMIAKDRDGNIKSDTLQKIIDDNKEENLSTHLYISDFQHLWVGRIKSITNKLPKDGQTLPFYKDKNVEVWFEIEDFLLIEHNHDKTATKLSEFYIDNDHSDLKINGLSPFTTSIKYPCLIQDLAEAQYFDAFDDNECSHLILKDNPAITKNSSGQLLKTLHSYTFPEELYAKIPHAAKIEIEAAEIDMLEQRHHNMHKIAFSYLKTLEIVLNDLVVQHIKRKGLSEHFFVDATSAPPKLFLNPTKDYYIPLKQFSKNFSTAHLLNFIDRCQNQSHLGFKKSFSEHKTFLRYCKDLQKLIQDNHLIEIRNALAHGEADKLTFKDAMAIRNIIIGCGTSGVIYDCYRHFYKEKFQHLSKVTEFNKSKAEIKSDKKKDSNLKLVG
jgi:hypothetical protein